MRGGSAHPTRRIMTGVGGGHQRTLRGGIVAFVPLVVLLVWTANWFAGVILGIPFLVLGARIERDGDWSSPRRRGTLIVVAILTVVALGAWQILVIAGWILAPVIGIVVWLASGPGDGGRNPFIVQTQRRSRGENTSP